MIKERRGRSKQEGRASSHSLGPEFRDFVLTQAGAILD